MNSNKQLALRYIGISAVCLLLFTVNFWQVEHIVTVKTPTLLGRIMGYSFDLATMGFLAGSVALGILALKLIASKAKE